VTWAYGTSGGLGYHSQRGIATLDLRPIKKDPTSPTDPSASTPSGGEGEASSDTDGLAVALAVSGGAAAGIVLLALVVLAVALVVRTVIRRRRRSADTTLLNQHAEIVRRGSIQQVQMGSVVGEPGQADVEQKPKRPRAPRPPAPPPPSEAQWGPGVGEEEELPSYTSCIRENAVFAL